MNSKYEYVELSENDIKKNIFLIIQSIYENKKKKLVQFIVEFRKKNYKKLLWDNGFVEITQKSQ